MSWASRLEASLARQPTAANSAINANSPSSLDSAAPIGATGTIGTATCAANTPLEPVHDLALSSHVVVPALMKEEHEIVILARRVRVAVHWNGYMIKGVESITCDGVRRKLVVLVDAALRDGTKLPQQAVEQAAHADLIRELLGLEKLKGK